MCFYHLHNIVNICDDINEMKMTLKYKTNHKSVIILPQQVLLLGLTSKHYNSGNTPPKHKPY